jgi:protease IV
MKFARKVWKLLVALKDGLALVFLLLFFAALYALLSARPGPGQVREGALLLDLAGVIVEEPAAIDLLTLLLSAEAPVREFRSRDVVRALRLAADDDRVKAVVLDMSAFLGGGLVHLQEIGEAMDEVREAGKPVLSYGLAYYDDSVLLAAHSSEAWLDPMGGAFVMGPGGSLPYFGPLLDKLKVTTHVFRVGTYKDAVEPWTLDGPSQSSREANAALLEAYWQVWQDDYARARPKVDIARITGDPVAWVESAGGDLARAAKNAGLVDRIGSRTQFGMRVAEIVGDDSYDDTAGSYAHTGFDAWVAANPEEEDGKAIGVVTIAGEIIDGDAGPGVAGGDRITRILDEALDSDLAALVVRIDSPGGSVIASEQIRLAIERFKAKDIPVVVSMANVAASGGVWVATAGERIFAEPATITGSIGVFAVLPTFEETLAEYGVHGEGVRTTPLSGQPDLIGGLTPEISRIIQANVESIYRRFLAIVGKSMDKPRAEVETFAEGRPWIGGTARQLGLVDQFGGLDDALAHAAKQAGIDDGGWHAEFLGAEEDSLGALLMQGPAARLHARPVARDLVGFAAQRQAELAARAIADAARLVSLRGVQAYCLECPPASSGKPLSAPERPGVLQFARLLGIMAE